MAAKPTSSLSPWERRQLQATVLDALAGLGVDAQRLHRAYRGVVDGRLAPWCVLTGFLAILVDLGVMDARELRRRGDAYFKFGLGLAAYNQEHDWMLRFDSEGRLGEVYDTVPQLHQENGAWWVSGLPPYAERWQAIGVGWAYRWAWWAWPEEVAVALDRRGFPRVSHPTEQDSAPSQAKERDG